jgi:RHS repeat-associated protein
MNALTSDQSAYYYGSSGALRFVERRRATAYDYVDDGTRVVVDSEPGTWVQEEHRFDGLGRRVLSRVQISGSCTTVNCESTIQRYVWDGNQLVAESRGRGGAGASSAALESDTTSGNGENGTPATYGQVWYAHAGGLDAPVGVLKMGGGTGAGGGTIPAVIAIFPVTNARGAYAIATFQSTGTVPVLLLPGTSASAFRPQWTPDAPPPTKAVGAWVGSLLFDQSSPSGLTFRRHRFVDPTSGRFTSVDPSGLAGGLGVYTFAGGDPVNYSDPFGLKLADRGACSIYASKCGDDVQGLMDGLESQAGAYCLPIPDKCAALPQTSAQFKYLYHGTISLLNKAGTAACGHYATAMLRYLQANAVVTWVGPGKLPNGYLTVGRWGGNPREALIR